MRKVLLVWMALFFFLAVFGPGCKHEPEMDEEFAQMAGPTGGGGIDSVLFGGIPCDPDSVYFDNQILPFLLSTCAQPGCHDVATAQDGVVLTDYWSIINTGDVDAFDPYNSDLYDVLIDLDPDDRMPPQGEDPLTPDQIQMIFDWIAQGAPNNYCNSCDTSDVSYSDHILPLVALKCQGCHSGGQPSGGQFLNNHADISAIAANGALAGSIQGSNGFVQMPYNSGPLPQCEVDMILSWIADGFPNN